MMRSNLIAIVLTASALTIAAPSIASAETIGGGSPLTSSNTADQTLSSNETIGGGITSGETIGGGITSSETIGGGITSNETIGGGLWDWINQVFFQ